MSFSYREKLKYISEYDDNLDTREGCTLKENLSVSYQFRKRMSTVKHDTPAFMQTNHVPDDDKEEIDFRETDSEGEINNGITNLFRTFASCYRNKDESSDLTELTDIKFKLMQTQRKLEKTEQTTIQLQSQINSLTKTLKSLQRNQKTS